jgi:ADP-heptose:LPS heptosyltransferase
MGHEVYLFTWPRCAGILEGWELLDGIALSMEQKEFPGIKFDYLFVPAVGAHLTPNIERRCKEIIRQKIPTYGKHESEYMFDFARKLGYRGPMPPAYVEVTNDNKVNVLDFLEFNTIYYQEVVHGEFEWKSKPYICINASYIGGHHWYLKHWNNNNYAELVECLGLTFAWGANYIVFVGAQKDMENANEIIEKSGHMFCINACGWSKDIKDTAALIKYSKGVIGNDGGLAHVAAALGIPSVTIFTFTNPIKNRPFAKNAKLAMTPCEKRTVCQHRGNLKECHDRQCMNLSVDKVFDKVSEMLGFDEF